MHVSIYIYLLTKEIFKSLFTALVNSLYPHNPKAVHDRLQSMFDRLEDLKENDRNMMTVTKLLQVVTLKHPEVLTLIFDFLSKLLTVCEIPLPFWACIHLLVCLFVVHMFTTIDSSVRQL